ncbi:NUDIX hydrolase [Chryseobacterium koreense]|uniref:NUDIX hydrolase n=1 Tax=Chryseobacterium koreense TaxID=232216 RepID=UPI0026EB60B4|nr:NUDIX domain-containing protein [Chryseobacterium koreense]
MYKVFVNEKRLTFSKNPEEGQKQVRFEDASSLEIAVDLLENTSCPEINIFGENIEEIWAEFGKLFKTVGAAGGVVQNKNGEILFIYRIGRWDLPKGKIEKGESLESAALREVQEETGLQNLELENFINKTYHTYTERDGVKILKTTHWFSMKFVGEESPVPQIEEGISQVSWKNKSQIEDDVFQRTFKNIKLILNDYWESAKIEN